MSVESFDPSAIDSAPSADDIAALCTLAVAHVDGDPELTAAEVERFAALATRAEWVATLAEAEDATLVALVRLIAVGEAAHGTWAAGEKSPVIPLVRLLKARKAYPAELTGWIKARSKNRFLPHGSLMDRL